MFVDIKLVSKCSDFNVSRETRHRFFKNENKVKTFHLKAVCLFVSVGQLKEVMSNTWVDTETHRLQERKQFFLLFPFFFSLHSFNNSIYLLLYLFRLFSKMFDHFLNCDVFVSCEICVVLKSFLSSKNFKNTWKHVFGTDWLVCSNESPKPSKRLFSTKKVKRCRFPNTMWANVALLRKTPSSRKSCC